MGFGFGGITRITEERTVSSMRRIAGTSDLAAGQ